MTPKEHTILLVSDDPALRAAARHELETIDDRRHVSSVCTVDAARRIVEDAAPAVILLAETLETGDLLEQYANRLGAAVSSLAFYAPVVVIGDDGHQTELSGLVAAGAADYVVRTGECLAIALGLVERRLRQAQTEAQSVPAPRQYSAAPAMTEDRQFLPGRELHSEDFGEVLRHELNNPLTGILGNAELLLAEIHRKSDGRLPQGAPQRLETIAALAVRLRESVRRLSTEWESRRHAVHAP